MSNIRLFYSKSLSLNLTDKLDKSQSHYVTKVMRIKENEVFSLFNNSGDALKELVKDKYESHKLPQLLDRITFYKPDSLAELKTLIETLAYIYDNRNNYNQYEDTLFKELGRKVQGFIDQNISEQDGLKMTIKNYLFENLKSVIDKTSKTKCLKKKLIG